MYHIYDIIHLVKPRNCSHSYRFLVRLHHHYGEDYCFCYYYYYYYYYYFYLSTPFFQLWHMTLTSSDRLTWETYIDLLSVTLTYFSRSQVTSKMNFLKFKITFLQKLWELQQNDLECMHLTYNDMFSWNKIERQCYVTLRFWQFSPNQKWNATAKTTIANGVLLTIKDTL